jgi:hypothetical protein
MKVLSAFTLALSFFGIGRCAGEGAEGRQRRPATHARRVDDASLGVIAPDCGVGPPLIPRDCRQNCDGRCILKPQDTTRYNKY